MAKQTPQPKQHFVAVHPTSGNAGQRESAQPFTHAVIRESGEIVSAHTSLKQAERNWKRVKAEDETAALVTVAVMDGPMEDATPSEPRAERLDEALAAEVPAMPEATEPEPVEAPEASQAEEQVPTDATVEPKVEPGAQVLIKLQGKNHGAVVVEVREDGRIVTLMGKVPTIITADQIWKVKREGTEELAREAEHLYREAVEKRREALTRPRSQAPKVSVEPRDAVKVGDLEVGTAVFLAEKGKAPYTIVHIGDYPQDAICTRDANGFPVYPCHLKNAAGTSNRFLKMDDTVYVARVAEEVTAA